MDYDALMNAVNDPSHWLHRLVAAPFKAGAVTFDANPNLEPIVGGISSDMILSAVDREYGGMVRRLEIVGMVVGLLIPGAHALALTCAKPFLHTQLNHAIGNGSVRSPTLNWLS